MSDIKIPMGKFNSLIQPLTPTVLETRNDGIMSSGRLNSQSSMCLPNRRNYKAVSYLTTLNTKESVDMQEKRRKSKLNQAILKRGTSSNDMLAFNHYMHGSQKRFNQSSNSAVNPMGRKLAEFLISKTQQVLQPVQPDSSSSMN
jgi:hypothetical protein